MLQTFLTEGPMLQSKVGPGINPKSLLILGTRGVPAAHGGFETFAERLALYLVDKGWSVTVYCQEDSNNGFWGEPIIEYWNGIRRVRISTSVKGAAGTIVFDWASVRHALNEPGIPLVLGYNTAMFSLLLRLKGKPVLMNMDGIEWKRKKWGCAAKLWFYANEWCGARLASKLIADHPAIADYLANKRAPRDIVTIAYGADEVLDAPLEPISELGLLPKRYFLSIGRIEPENSTLEIIEAYVLRNRYIPLVCLGRFDPEKNAYHAQIRSIANGRVLFPGTIYNKRKLQAIRYHALAYLHGHTVGGTNPSLVEALGAGNAVIAHDNRFNRWVTGNEQTYFVDVDTCDNLFTEFETRPDKAISLGKNARRQFRLQFTWREILGKYESLLTNEIGGDISGREKAGESMSTLFQLSNRGEL